MHGASRGNPRISTYGGIFRDNLGILLGAFLVKIGVCTSFQAKLHRIMLAIKYGNKKN